MVEQLAEGLSTTKTIILLVLVTVLGTGSALILHWKFGGEGIGREPQDVELLKISPILYTDKDTYYIGDSVQVEVALSNGEDMMVELRWIEYDLTIYGTGQKIYWVRVDHDFDKLVLVEPGSTYRVPVGQTWRQMDSMNKQVPTGTYILELKLLPYNYTVSKIIVIDETR